MIPHKLLLHWFCSFREKIEHTHLHSHIHTFTRKASVLNICTSPYILVYQTQQLRVVEDKKMGNGLNLYMCVYICKLNKDRKSNLNLKNYKYIVYLNLAHLAIMWSYPVEIRTPPRYYACSLFKKKKKKKKLVPGIAFNCQEALWPQHGRHIYVRPCPGLERTTAGLDGRRSNH